MRGGARLGRLLAAGLAAAAVASSAPAAGEQQASDACPPAAPVEELERGELLTGFTVSAGRSPEPFSAEVLGVLEGAMGPGRDVVVVEASSDDIDRAGGIWAGMSGSPVYTSDGRLVGAVSLGLTWGPSPIAGITPAQDMYELLAMPAGGAARARRVELSGRVGTAVARRTGAPPEEAALEPLRVPLGVSGVDRRGLRLLRREVRRARLPLQVHAASSASPGTGTGTAAAGENFAAVLSYGDVTMAGIGTTTAVCDGRALAFGHPFSWGGDAILGANQADALGVVGETLGAPYKLATVAEPVGTVDQDRLAGLRAQLGVMPAVIPVSATVDAPELARRASGQSLAVRSDVVPSLAFLQLFGRIDTTWDEIGPGSSTVSWTVTGRRAGGRLWSLSRDNMFVSDFDISIDSALEINSFLWAILSNPFEEVSFESVEARAEVVGERITYAITGVAHSTDGRRWRSERRVAVRPGRPLRLRVQLTPSGGGEPRTVALTVRIPERFRGGELLVGGGGGSFGFCMFDGEDCGAGTGSASDFDSLLTALEDTPRGNEVVVRLTGRRTTTVRAAVDRFVTGHRRLLLLPAAR